MSDDWQLQESTSEGWIDVDASTRVGSREDHPSCYRWVRGERLIRSAMTDEGGKLLPADGLSGRCGMGKGVAQEARDELARVRKVAEELLDAYEDAETTLRNEYATDDLAGSIQELREKITDYRKRLGLDDNPTTFT